VPVIRVLLTAMALTAVVTGCSGVPGGRPASAGLAARQALVANYLDALERRDEAAIKALVSPGVDASADIAQALGTYGGIKLHDTRATWLDEFDGIFVVATIRGTGDDGLAYEIRVPMGRDDGRYYLGLGQAAPTGSESSPESPAP
jgi:hypothetical protein